jgi:uncharacterized spore protein YtfJ
MMDVDEVLAQARDAMTVKRVFGEPYEKDGVTVVPVANVMGGAGAGGGAGMASRAGASGDEPAVEGAPDSGYGMGYGVRATPAGVYVIRGGEVEWKPAVDTNSLFLQRALVALVGLLVLRSIVKTLVRR